MLVMSFGGSNSHLVAGGEAATYRGRGDLSDIAWYIHRCSATTNACDEAPCRAQYKLTGNFQYDPSVYVLPVLILR